MVGISVSVGIIPKEKAAIASMLRQYDYNTYCVDKWHNAPDTDTGPEGPFDPAIRVLD
jgi:arylsulfatase A-like enzyme